MLPSRGLTRNPASALRHSLSRRIKPRTLSTTLSTRQFSQVQSQSSVLSRPRLCRTNIPYGHSHITPSVSTAGIAASSVFAQRSGATRNISLWPFPSFWPFQSKSQSPPATETAATAETTATPFQPPPEPPAQTPSPVVETSSLSSPPVELATAADAADISQLPDDLLHALYPQSFLDIPQHIGYLRELGLDYGFGPTAACQWLLESVHVFGGMPWWGSIASVALLFRLVMFYPTLVGAKHSARMQKAQRDPAYIKAKADFQESIYQGRDRATSLQARREMRRLMKAAGSSMWKPLIGATMFPFSYGMFRLMRGMASLPVPGLETGGLAWFTDLTVHDPFFILPAASVGLGSLLIVTMQRANVAPPDEMQQTIMKGMKYFLPPLMFLGTAWLPACLQWFFITVSLGSLAQAQATVTPAVRRWFGLPAIERHSPDSVIQYQGPTSPSSTSASASSTLQERMSAATKAFKLATGTTEKKALWKKAQAYENRRAEEEKQRTLERMEEIRRRRAERRP